MNLYWFGRRAELIGKELRVYLYDEDRFFFDALKGKFSVDFTKYHQDFLGGILDRPFRIGTSIGLLSSDGFVLLYVRDPNSYVYPRRFQVFGGILRYKNFLEKNAFQTFAREVVVIKDGRFVLPKFNYFIDDKIRSIYRMTIEKARMLPIPLPKDDTFEEVPFKKVYPCDAEPVTIKMFIDNELTEISRGFFYYDEKLNSLELVYLYEMPYKVSDVKLFSVEAFVNPVVAVPSEVLPSLKRDYFTPSTLPLLDVLGKCYEVV